MASRWLDPLGMKAASGTGDLSTSVHIGSQFPGSGVNQTPMADCRAVCTLNVSERCRFIRTNPDCRTEGGYLDYLEGLFCHFPPGLLPLAVTLHVLWLLYLFLILGVTAAKFFCPNLSAISTTLKLSHNVAGVTFLAFGNGAPDVFSALVAFADPRTASLAIGALFGAGVLVTTVVAGGITILRPFTAASRPFLRDITFYMAAVFLTFTALYHGRVTLLWALGYLGLYVFYVLTVILCTWIYQRQRRRSLVYSMPGTPELSDSEDDRVSSNTNSYDYGEEYRPLFTYQNSTAQVLAEALSPLDSQKWRNQSVSWRLLKVLKLPVEVLLLLTVPVVDPDRDDRNWKRPLNCLQLVISPLVLVLTLQSGAYAVYEIGGLVPVWAVVVIVGTGLATVTFFATSNSEPPRLHWVRVPACGLGEGVRGGGLGTGAHGHLQEACQGVISNHGKGTFNLGICPKFYFPGGARGPLWPRPVGSGGLQQASLSLSLQLEPDGLLVWVLAGALGLSLVLSLVSVPLQCFQLSKGYGCCLLLFYSSFLVVALLTEFGVIHLKGM
ncbi:PREDICTED: sodium/potassium/calcium exchanger 6, mitochondrial [Dipodomys ordii]|uniref:Sodium/potassium/calcium exchanger 6, mitochondrial n=1 Tax=Dipodomys ordii TaxID=10020 RepID=A0A1S3EZB0_DIPOR|nr:PREDICTED: sodium/potassium/calcium exchanger 6, mitochondrial [Dipodomys ordii]